MNNLSSLEHTVFGKRYILFYSCLNLSNLCRSNKGIYFFGAFSYCDGGRVFFITNKTKFPNGFCLRIFPHNITCKFREIYKSCYGKIKIIYERRKLQNEITVSFIINVFNRRLMAYCSVSQVSYKKIKI